jgi:FtsH-binding integral membrane protein
MNYEPYGSSYPRDLAQGRQAGVAAFFRYVYAWMALALVVTGLAAGLIVSNPTLLVAAARYNLFLAMATFGLGMFTSVRVGSLKSTTAAQLFLLYSAALGVTLAPALYLYTQASVAKAFFIAGGTFGATATYGYATKRDLTGVGQFAMIGLIGGIIASVVNIFMQSAQMDFVVSYAFVVVFASLTAYDNQRLRQMYAQAGGTTNLAIIGALTMYLNFINLFLSLLRIFGDRRE